jgi:hypothetical protein
MSKARGEFAKRHQLFILEIAGCEMSRAIDHHVNKNGGQFGTFTNHLGHIGATHSDHFRTLFGNDVSRRRNQARVRHEASHVSSPPLHDFASAGPVIHVNGQISGKYDVQPLDRSLFGGYYGSGIETT